MEVILREDVAMLGRMGDVVKVRDGYARNYLIPRGLAVEANRRNVRMLEHQKRLVADKKERERHRAESTKGKLEALTVVIPARAGEADRLFGSVTNLDVERALKALGVEIDRRQVLLDEPIRQLGTYPVPVSLGPEIKAILTVQVIREE